MVCSQIVCGVLTNGVFSKCVGCFNKWYVFKLCGGVFTNSVFLQIVWMSVCVVQIRWVRPTPYWSVRGKNCEQMHLEIIQSILPDMSAMWVSQVQCELSESDLKFVKKFTRPSFRAKEFYTLKMRKSRLFLPAINSENASLSVIWPSYG